MAEAVEELASALAANLLGMPGQTITEPVRALAYFRAQARRQIATPAPSVVHAAPEAEHAGPRVLRCDPVTGPPPGAVYIGRAVPRIGLAASRWENPFIIAPDAPRPVVVTAYEAWIVTCPELMAALPELAGRCLACWCAPAECHGDVLLRLANP